MHHRHVPELVRQRVVVEGDRLVAAPGWGILAIRYEEHFAIGGNAADSLVERRQFDRREAEHISD